MKRMLITQDDRRLRPRLDDKLFAMQNTFDREAWAELVKTVENTEAYQDLLSSSSAYHQLGTARVCAMINVLYYLDIDTNKYFGRDFYEWIHNTFTKDDYHRLGELNRYRFLEETRSQKF